MNATRRPRRRPRRRSVNFRSFYWLLLRVAVFEVLSTTAMMGEPRGRLREELARLDRHKVLAWGFRHLAEYERRRTWWG